jgi:hypothetical protein
LAASTSISTSCCGPPTPLLFEHPDSDFDTRFRPDLLDRSHLVNLAVILPDDAGQQVVHELQQIVDIRSHYAFSGAEIVFTPNEQEAIFYGQLRSQRERSAERFSNGLQVAVAFGSLAACKPSDSRMLRNEKIIVRNIPRLLPNESLCAANFQPLQDLAKHFDDGPSNCFGYRIGFFSRDRQWR